MKYLTVRQRIFSSFAVILALMAIMGAVAYGRLAVVADEFNLRLTQWLPGLTQSQQLLNAIEANYALTERHVDQNDRAALGPLASQVKANARDAQTVARSYEAALFGDKGRAAFDAFRRALEPYQRWDDEVIALSSNGKTHQAARALLRSRLDPAFDKVRSTVGVMVAFNREKADLSTAAIEAAIRSAYVDLLVSFTIAVLLASLCGYLLMRDLTSQLRQVARIADQIAAGDLTVPSTAGFRKDEIGKLVLAFDRMVANLSALIGLVQKSGILVNTSVTAIAATAKEQQATATETAATVTEISATSTHISATSRNLVTTMSEVATVAEQTATLASAGQASLLHMEETMHNVMEAGASITHKLTILNEKAGNITQVVTTITRVADQTNLLSLNAAIEAEKAGDYGRGFSVVATEIRRLADQTAVATYDIEQTVKEILSAVSAGVMGMDKFSEAVRRGMDEVLQTGVQLTQIVQQVQALAPRVESVNEGMQASATGAEQITQALTNLTEAAQQTVSSMHTSNVAVDELTQAAIGLRTGVSTFQLQA